MRFLIGLNFLVFLSITLVLTSKYDYGYFNILLFSIYFITSVNIFNYMFFIIKSRKMKDGYMSDDFENITNFEKYILVGYSNVLSSSLGIEKKVFVNTLFNGIKLSIIFSCSAIIFEYNILIALSAILFVVYLISQYISFNKIIDIDNALKDLSVREIIISNISNSIEFSEQKLLDIKNKQEGEDLTLEDLEIIKDKEKRKEKK